jgi:uncharacterized protein YqjF (DUF2071 family)
LAVCKKSAAKYRAQLVATAAVRCQNRDMSASPKDSMIDRIAPTRHPAERSVMRQRWARLLFLHWPVETQLLRDLIPTALEIDTFDGQAFVGLIPFTMTGVRPTWAPPVVGLSSFHEVNVRTYVHRAGRDPGVWFFSLDAANAIAVRIARGLWKLPYHYARMSLASHPLSTRGGEAIWEYQSQRLWPGPTPAGCHARYAAAGSPSASIPGTVEHFLVERYFLYTRSGSRILRGQVHHAPYPLQGAAVHELEDSLVSAAGIPVAGSPPLCHYASEVRVHVYRLKQV